MTDRLLLTVQHTGTWFFITYLRKAANIRFTFEKNVTQNLHQHVLDDPRLRKVPASSELAKEKVEARLPHLSSLVLERKTFIPLRDPVTSLITREKRYWKYDHSFVIHSLAWLASLDGLPNVMIRPGVDFHRDYEQRVQLLNEVARHWEVDVSPLATEKYAESWAPVRSTKTEFPHLSNELDEVYKNEGFEGIRKVLPTECELLLNTPSIKELFIRYGYDLPWFNAI